MIWSLTLLLSASAFLQIESQWVDVCSSHVGSLSVADSSYLTSFEDQTSGQIITKTVILNHQEEIGFRCFQKDFSAFASSETKVDLSFNPEMQASQVSNSETGALIQSLNTSQLRVLNEVNYKMFTVTCEIKEKMNSFRFQPINCSVNVIVIFQVPLYCQTNEADFQCKAHTLLNYVNSKEIMPDPSERYGYSVYQPINQTWVFCKELNKDGYAMKKGVHLDGHTETIACPLFNNNNNNNRNNNNNNIQNQQNDSRNFLMRVGRTKSNGFSMALPSLTEKPKTTTTYFVILLDVESFTQSSSTFYLLSYWLLNLSFFFLTIIV